MIRNLVAAVLCFVAVTVADAAPGKKSVDIDALLIHESHAITADGVKKDIAYRELFFRRDGKVWAERVLPLPRAEGESSVAHSGHRMDLHDFNFNAAAKYISREKENEAQIAFVNRADKLILHIEPENHQTVGFGGAWKNAYYLVDPESLNKMKVRSGAVPASTTHWYESRQGEAYTRILWDEVRDYPLYVEVGTRDGRERSILRVKRLPLQAKGKLPWNNLGGYAAKEYNDLLD